MRYNTVGLLGSQTYSMDRYHNQTRTISWRRVYLNRYYDNITLQQQAAITDGKKLAQYSIRTSEYKGERMLIADDETWTVTLTSRKGDDTVLTVETEMGNNGTV